jgi:hypothetical protein
VERASEFASARDETASAMGFSVHKTSVSRLCLTL